MTTGKKRINPAELNIVRGKNRMLRKARQARCRRGHSIHSKGRDRGGRVGVDPTLYTEQTWAISVYRKGLVPTSRGSWGEGGNYGQVGSVLAFRVKGTEESTYGKIDSKRVTEKPL